MVRRNSFRELDSVAHVEPVLRASGCADHGNGEGLGYAAVICTQEEVWHCVSSLQAMESIALFLQPVQAPTLGVHMEAY